MTLRSVLRQLKSHGSRRNVEGMARFGIIAKKAASGVEKITDNFFGRIGIQQGWKSLEVKAQLTDFIQHRRHLSRLVGSPK